MHHRCRAHTTSAVEKVEEACDVEHTTSATVEKVEMACDVEHT